MSGAPCVRSESGVGRRRSGCSTLRYTRAPRMFGRVLRHIPWPYPHFMAFAPEWPAEDDFAVNNWTGASSLMGRFVLPRMHGHYDRFHSLEGLTERERRRWRWTLWAFCWKIARLAGRRAILLKTPSHTA